MCKCRCSWQRKQKQYKLRFDFFAVWQAKKVKRIVLLTTRRYFRVQSVQSNSNQTSSSIIVDLPIDVSFSYKIWQEKLAWHWESCTLHVLHGNIATRFRETKENNKQYSQNIKLSANLAVASAESLNQSSQHVFPILW